MIKLNNYIIEKLHINKDSIKKRNKDNIIRFIVIYSDKKGNVNFKFFINYENAIYFAKEEYYLDGYCLSEEDYYEIQELIYKDTTNFIMNTNWKNKILDYAEEKNLIRLFDYDK